MASDHKVGWDHMALRAQTEPWVPCRGIPVAASLAWSAENLCLATLEFD